MIRSNRKNKTRTKRSVGNSNSNFGFHALIGYLCSINSIILTFQKVRMGVGTIAKAYVRILRSAVRRHKKEISLGCHDHCFVACGLSRIRMTKPSVEFTASVAIKFNCSFMFEMRFCIYFNFFLL